MTPLPTTPETRKADMLSAFSFAPFDQSRTF